MEDYKKDIIMVYHIPVDGLTRQQAQEMIAEFHQYFYTGEFFREMFLPKTDSGGKIEIEVINLKGHKTENIQIKIEELDDRLMKYFEKDKWLRKSKIERILKWK
jgi:hypothetical protein